MSKEWMSFRDKTPVIGRLYDITNDNPFENKILNVQQSVKCRFLDVDELGIVFDLSAGGKFFNVRKSEFDTWWFCDAEVKNPVESETNDPVHKPKHYTTGAGFECIECMQLILTREQYEGFLLGNAFKYIWRHKLKGNPKQDLEKADWYLSRAIEIGGCIDNTSLLYDKVSSLMDGLKDK